MKRVKTLKTSNLRSMRQRCLAPMLAGLGMASIATAGLAADAASVDASAFAACTALRLDADRLACFDRLAGSRSAVGSAAATTAAAPAASSPASGAAAIAAPALKPGSTVAEQKALETADARGGGVSYFDELWELTPERKRGTFRFSGYRPNYLFPVHVSNGINRNPSSPSPDHSGQLPDYRRLDAKLQLSIRTKLFEDVLLPGGDLWFAYTAQSIWQIYSGELSRPFRSTDHEPELIYIVPTRVDLPGGFKLRMAGLGIAHQSNGQGLPFSRSWNRVYALAGVEKGNFALSARYNERIRESGNDDNPDLVGFRGRTDLFAIWTPGAQTVSALWKTNFDFHRGSLQVDWTYPVKRSDPKGLRWYVQVFTGYGESLIDYNYRQTSIGAGLTLLSW